MNINGTHHRIAFIVSRTPGLSTWGRDREGGIAEHLAVEVPPTPNPSPQGGGGCGRRAGQAMNIDGKPYRTIWLAADGVAVEIIDQTRLPHALVTVTLKTVEDAAHAIKTMQVRGAPLIGVTAAYGVCLALRQDASDEGLDRAIAHLAKQRPTAINLRWALDQMRAAVRNQPRQARVAAAYARAAEIAEADVKTNRAIGGHGAKLIAAHAQRKKPGERVNILTHCNAGWLACVDVRHGHGADLRGARCRHHAARVGRRDAAAQSGRGAHRLRARRPRRAAHHHRRQRRRAPDAAGPGRSRASSAPTASPATATPPTRSARI